MQGMQITESLSILDFTRIGQAILPGDTLPTIYIVDHVEPRKTFLSLLAYNLNIDVEQIGTTDHVIEVVVNALLAPRDSPESLIRFIDTLYLSEQSMDDDHTEALLDAIQERQGLSPLNVWVWKTERQEWEKVRPLRQ
ncbi:MAG: hypothetical protein UY35_C0014G0020 [Candidatus Saccharibacteria bacterium GW2011_GWC2_48_9]|nr:MAG: hypothetical protein UY35_C0014G0020 [Candidatus Saccharibacteria bacterium GW2011_GWC2_48_9]